MRIAVLAVLFFQQWWIQRQQVQTIPYAVRELVSSAFEKALDILGKYRQQLDEGAKRLLEKETLTREELPVLEGFKMAAASGLSL